MISNSFLEEYAGLLISKYALISSVIDLWDLLVYT